MYFLLLLIVAVSAEVTPSYYIAGLVEHYAVVEGNPQDRMKENIDLYASHYPGAVANGV